MYRTIADFTADWARESASTLTVMRALTDGSLAQQVTPEGRSLGRLAWHVTGSIAEMLTHAGIGVGGLASEETPIPASAARIAAEYERAAAAAAARIADEWRDEDLPGEVPMYGERWSRALVLAVLVRHQAHHRGQMTVLMRQAGLVVPGVYGPAREEWAAMGMPPMA